MDQGERKCENVLHTKIVIESSLFKIFSKYTPEKPLRATIAREATTPVINTDQWAVLNAEDETEAAGAVRETGGAWSAFDTISMTPKTSRVRLRHFLMLNRLCKIITENMALVRSFNWSAISQKMRIEWNENRAQHMNEQGLTENGECGCFQALKCQKSKRILKEIKSSRNRYK